MSLLKQLAGDTAIYGVSNILSRILQYLLLTPYLTRIFDGPDTDKYGIHGLMYGFSAVLLIIFTFRMETAFFRYGSQEKYKANAFAAGAIPLIGFTMIMVLLVYLLAPQIAGILTRPEDARYVQYFAFIIGLDTLAALPFAKLRLENKAWKFVAIKIINIVATVIFTLSWLEACPRLIAAGFTWFERIYHPDFLLDYIFISNLIASAITILLLLPSYTKMNWTWDKSLWKEMLIYAAPLVLVGVAGVINQLSDRYFLTHWLPGTLDENLDTVGLYNGCIKIAVLMSLFITAFNYAAEPFFFKNANRSDAKEIYANVARVFTLVTSFAFLGITMYLDIFKYIIDADYWPALGIVPVILLAYLFLGLYYNISIWYKLTDRTNYGAIIAVLAATLTISMNILLIPRIGIMGSAYTTLVVYAFMVVLGTIFGKKYYPVPYNWGAIARYLGLAVGLFLLATWWHQTYPAGIIQKMIINTGIIILYLGVIFFTDKNFLRSIAKGD